MSALPLIQEKESVSVPVVVEFLEGDGVYMVSVPWLQGCRAWGDTLDEALRAIPDNIRAMLEARHAHGDPLPPPLQNVDLSSLHLTGLRRMKYRELAKRLRKLGCEYLRPGHGSHRIWRNPWLADKFNIHQPPL